MEGDFYDYVIIGGNNNAATIMIGEKDADMIRQDSSANP